MAIVSYAQNYEDVMLWRALGHIKDGFYIDVGANDPVVHSVTKLFYENGWNGINVEPLKTHVEDLKKRRPRDINLPYAAGNHDGELELWECDVRGWATADPEVMEAHEAAGYRGIRYKVPVLTLSSICEKYASKHIHFMKIDVEGYEKSVLEGMDFSRHRPWILLIEATKPNSPEENYSEWEPVVLSAGYTFVYCDGLNRFYVANEKEELQKELKYPPNVFDRFIRVEQYESEIRAQRAEAKASEAEAKASEAEAKASEAEAKASEAEAKASEAEANIHALLNSRSWRITAPLRTVGSSLRSIRQLAIRGLIKRLLQHASLYIQRRERLRCLLLKILNRFPHLKARLVGIARQTASAQRSTNYQMSVELENLTPHARRIYQDLKTAIESKKESR